MINRPKKRSALQRSTDKNAADLFAVFYVVMNAAHFTHVRESIRGLWYNVKVNGVNDYASIGRKVTEGRWIILDDVLLHRFRVIK